MLEHARTWAAKSVALHENTYNQLTLAKILAKQGKKTEAIKAAKRSSELGKATGMDNAQALLLLKQLGQ
jgi:hypothetical protein